MDAVAKHDSDMGHIWVDEAVGRMKASSYAFAILALCAAIGMAEGYDAQAMAFAAPLVSREWGLSAGQIGGLLGAAIVAMVAGNFLLAPLGDRWGRRPAILAALALVAVATGTGGYAPSFEWLLVSRIFAGLGLGLAFPTVIALAMEVMPRRLQALAVVIVGCGYPVGGAIGGTAAAALIKSHGYPAVFWLGGAATALLLLLCLPFLPESPLWLARRRPVDPSLPKLLARLGVKLPVAANSFGIKEPPVSRSPVGELFTPERWSRTLLLWLINFANLSLVYFYVLWLPTILANAGTDAAFAANALALFSAGGVVGGLVLVLVMQRVGPALAIGGAYLSAALIIAMLATTPVFTVAFLVLLAMNGAVIIGSQFCLNAVVNQYYPSDIRATASGYASGAGRLGAVAAPLVGAAIVHGSSDSWLAIGIGIVPAVVALGGLLTLVFAAPLKMAVRD